MRTAAKTLCRKRNVLSTGSGTVVDGVPDVDEVVEVDVVLDVEGLLDVDGVIDVDVVIVVVVVEVVTVRHACLRMLLRCSSRMSKSVTNM